MKLKQVRLHVKIAPQNYENGGKNSNFLKVRSKKWKRISKMKANVNSENVKGLIRTILKLSYEDKYVSFILKVPSKRVLVH